MDASLTELIPRALGSMVVVLAIMWIAARATKTRKFAQTFGTRMKAESTETRASIELISRQPLGRNASVSIIRAGDKELVLGVTETNVNVLAELGTTPTDIHSAARNAAGTIAQSNNYLRSYAEHPSHGATQASSQEPALSLVGQDAVANASTNAQRTGNNGSDSTPISEQAWKGLLGQVRERTVRH